MKFWNRRGVTTTETILILPFFLLGVFGLLQAVQIGIGLVIVNYGAGSVARRVGRDAIDIPTATQNHQSDFDGLMIAGLHSKTLVGCEDSNPSDPNAVAKTAIVIAQAELTAFPILGPLIAKVPGGFATSGNSTIACTESAVPAIGFEGGPPYKFVLRGMAVARRNYTQ